MSQSFTPAATTVPITVAAMPVSRMVMRTAASAPARESASAGTNSLDACGSQPSRYCLGVGSTAVARGASVGRILDRESIRSGRRRREGARCGDVGPGPLERRQAPARRPGLGDPGAPCAPAAAARR